MMKMSPEEIRFFERLREAGVLEDVNGNRPDASKGVILVTCADGDQMADIFNHTGNLTPRLHTLSLNGGGLILPPESPANTSFVCSCERRETALGDIFMEQIATARRLKGIDLVALHVHFPCGIARAHEMAPQQLMELLVSAKDRLKREMKGIKVCAFIHIAWPDDRKRTYFVSREKWVAHTGGGINE